MKLPSTVYQAWVYYPTIKGWGSSDLIETWGDALDWMICNLDYAGFRCIQIDFDVETNLPETCRDITADLVDAYIKTWDGGRRFPDWFDDYVDTLKIQSDFDEEMKIELDTENMIRRMQ